MNVFVLRVVCFACVYVGLVGSVFVCLCALLFVHLLVCCFFARPFARMLVWSCVWLVTWSLVRMLVCLIG